MTEEARLADLPDVLAHWREHGWARLGRVASDAELDTLRARAEDIMFGRVVHEGLFFQHDSPTGRYVDLRFGEGWVAEASRRRLGVSVAASRVADRGRNRAQRGPHGSVEVRRESDPGSKGKRSP